LTSTHPGLCAMCNGNVQSLQIKKKKKKGSMTTASSAGVSGVTGSGSQQPVQCPLLYSSLSLASSPPAIPRCRPTRPQNHCALPVLCTHVFVYCAIPSCYWSSPPTVNNVLTLPSPPFHCLPLKFRTTFIHTDFSLLTS
jgi:hypothetical protein